MNVHPTAIVHPDAQLADDVEIQPYSIIGPQARIGSGTVVGPHCVIEGDTVIGENNHFFSGSQVGVVSQDKKHRADLVGRVKIGNANQVREHVTISASTMESDQDDHRVTSMGNDCLLMALSHVAHDCHLGSGIILANSVALAGHVDIEDFAIISGLSGVHQDVVIGTMAYVGGMTRASQDVPPYMLVEGNPPRVCGPNTVGLRRNGVDEAARGRIKAMYRIMYRSDLNTTQALHEIVNKVEDSPERTHFVEFIRKSIRGII
jgi:UDP-N-acetylglucosamine acyltransferase